MSTQTLKIKYYYVKFVNQAKAEAQRVCATSENHAKKVFAKRNNIEVSSYITIVRKP